MRKHLKPIPARNISAVPRLDIRGNAFRECLKGRCIRQMPGNRRLKPVPSTGSRCHRTDCHPGSRNPSLTIRHRADADNGDRIIARGFHCQPGMSASSPCPREFYAGQESPITALNEFGQRQIMKPVGRLHLSYSIQRQKSGHQISRREITSRKIAPDRGEFPDPGIGGPPRRISEAFQFGIIRQRMGKFVMCDETADFEAIPAFPDLFQFGDTGEGQEALGQGFLAQRGAHDPGRTGNNPETFIPGQQSRGLAAAAGELNA